jgi:hypothetical protein
VNGKKIIERRLDATHAADESKVSFTVFDPKKVGGKEIVYFWLLEMEKSSRCREAKKIDGKSVSGVPTRNRLVEKL